MSVISFVDVDGRVVYIDREEWMASFDYGEYEQLDFWKEENQSEETPDEASEWLAKHGDDIKGLEGVEAMGKGDSPRPKSVDHETFDRNFEAVFGKQKKHVCSKFVWDEEKQCNLCYFCAEPEIQTRR